MGSVTGSLFENTRHGVLFLIKVSTAGNPFCSRDSARSNLQLGFFLIFQSLRRFLKNVKEMLGSEI